MIQPISHDLSRLVLVFTAASTLSLGACVGEPGETATSGESIDPIVYLDTDGNGAFDAVDIDSDGVADYALESEQTSIAVQTFSLELCLSPLVDRDGDGFIDGIDFDCDGQVDIELLPLDFGDGGAGGDDGGIGGDDGDIGAGSGGSQSCSASVSVHGDSLQIACSSDGEASSCTCTRNGVVEQTCSNGPGAICSFADNCCGF